jgi:hypothetical protein
VLRLTVDDAVKMALENNIDLNTDRIDPQISDTRVAAASGAFKPTVASSVQSNNQLQPPASFLVPTATRSDIMSSNAGLAQRLPWFGTTYNVYWTATHTNSNSFLNSYNPLVQSGLSVDVSQPSSRPVHRLRSTLYQPHEPRHRRHSPARAPSTPSRIRNRYAGRLWPKANVEARQSALELAQDSRA